MRFRGEGARQFEKIAPKVCGERIDRASNPPLLRLAGTDVATAEGADRLRSDRSSSMTGAMRPNSTRTIWSSGSGRRSVGAFANELHSFQRGSSE